ncbi:ATP-binding protein (plasmid) [Macrococcoides canis]|uniref:VirB4 family type IV secretion system protein n=1 Tax=Macrococcoides canis TaxID=1855823 RepID=UPI001F2541EB|nr:ATP-binding protein [Macrococcus canis]UJS28988.1 ATP-binding protein [Macrococcus canis]
MFKKKEKKRLTKPKHYELEGYDLEYIAEVQPQGGIKFGERFIENGMGYQACLLIYDFPNDVSSHWLNSIVNREGVIASVDFGSEENHEILQVINRSMKEQSSRISEEKNALSRNQSINTYQNLSHIGDSITKYGEVIKNINIRLYVSDHSQNELDKKVQTIRKDIQSKGFKCQLMLFESKDNYNCLYYNLTDQKKVLNYYRRGKASIPASTAGATYYFNHTEIMDPNGGFLGTTQTQGAVLLDMFLADSRRTYYNSIIFGAMGKGKSTLMKMIFEDMNARNNMIRGFDIAGDFQELVSVNGGKMIALNGAGGIINMMEVFATSTVEDENGLVIDEHSSFSAHSSKLQMQYKIYNTSLEETDLQDLGIWINDFYCSLGLWSKDKSIDKKITGLKPKEYPILEDFLRYLETVNTSTFTPERKRSLEKIISSTRSMVEDYGKIFNGHTTIEDILNEQIVFFDIKGLKDYGQRVFQCQVYTAITMIWSHALYHGQIGKKQVEDPAINNDDVQRFMLFIDECHNIINANSREVVQFMKNFMKEMRKYNAGCQLATQSPQELLPQGNELIVNDLKQIFELTQYKFLLGMDQSTLDKLKDVLGNTIKESEYALIPKLQRGQSILSIAGESIVFDVQPSKAQLKRFKGGL